jgi:cytochrome c553
MIIDLDRMSATEGVRVDAQYGAARTLRSVPIEAIIHRYAPPEDVDTAILHFANGMAVPLSFRSPEVMRRLRPAVARAIKLDGNWTAEFPILSRTDTDYFDVRPTRFQGNKIVVAELWHPALLSGTERAFSPWRHTDTLTGIEFVNDRAYLAQFEPSAATSRGAQIYGQVCRFCHGANREGAQFGWDFVDPLPISEYRKKDASLYYHLKYRPASAVTRGVMMPALPFVTEQDAAALLAWLRALAAQPLRPYRP